jgi:hypothetical protein
MSSRANKLIEGFKLGSLGVSKKPKVTLGSDEPGHVTILYDGFKLSIVTKTRLPTLYWEEPDGWCYGFAIRLFAKSFRLGLYGGPKLEMEKDRQSFATANLKWQLLSKSKSKNVEDLEPEFNTLAQSIRKEGIFKSLLQHFSVVFGGAAFQTWLEDRKFV